MSNSNLFPLAPKSSTLCSSAYSAVRKRKHQQSWYRSGSNFKTEMGYLASSSSSSSSSSQFPHTASSLPLTISQIFLSSQRTYCFLLSCLFLLNLEIIGCEPQGLEQNMKLQSFSKSSSASAAYLHQPMIAAGQNSDHSEGDHDHHHHHPLTSQNKQQLILITPRPPPLAENHSPFFKNQTSNFTPEENTASVIASSFRTFDPQQPPSDSKEEAEPDTSNNQGQKRRTHVRNCDTMVLKRCLGGLPPMNATGIPSTPQAVNTACRIYDAGISCFDTWAKSCLPEKHRQKVKESITGAHEMYTFLCKDPKFRSDYLKHKVCYRKLSPHWDECSRQFIDGLKRNTKHNYTAFCCIRIEFLTCVSKYSSYSCNREASKFLMKMAETLVRSTIRTKSDTTDYCAYIHPENCIPIQENSGVTPRPTAAQSTIVILINSFIFMFLPSSASAHFLSSWTWMFWHKPTQV